MAKKHYHVLCGLSGCYMPDSNDVYRTREEAREGAKEMARHWASDLDIPRDRHGMFKRYRIDDDLYVFGHNEIRVTECDIEDCLEDLESD